MKQNKIILKEFLLILVAGIPVCFIISATTGRGIDETILILFSILIGGYLSSRKNISKMNKTIVLVILFFLGELFLGINQKPWSIMTLYFFILLGSLVSSMFFSKNGSDK